MALIDPVLGTFYPSLVLLNENSNFTEILNLEESFELTESEPFFINSRWLMQIGGMIITIISVIAIIVWYITRPPKLSTTESTVKAQLIGLGNGTLEFIDNTLRFHWEKGYIRKQKKIVREIPITDIESMNRTENEFSVSWKGVTDLFIIEESELAGSIFEIIPQISREQKRMYEEKELAKQTRNKLIKTLSVAMETLDSLFDILVSLHGWIDWPHLEYLLNRSEEKARNFDPNVDLIHLDFAKLRLVIKAHLLEETSKETYGILKYLHDYFNRLTTENKFLRQLHPNFHDTKTTILAYYLLNDIMLGKMVGDVVEKEIKTLVTMLETLSSITGSKINIETIKNSIDQVDFDNEKEKAIKEIRMVFRDQLEDFEIIKSRGLIKHIYPHLKLYAV